MTQSEKIADSPLMRRLGETERRFAELQDSLNDPATLSNPTRIVAASKEAGSLEPVVTKFREYKAASQQVAELTEMAANRADAEMSELAAAELPDARAKADGLLEDLKDVLVSAEDNAIDSFFFEIRAGTGGEEAALFAPRPVRDVPPLLRAKGVEV
jgi:peptide chain release factor 1